ncbi:hypothetical protein K456DRAFT_31093 [Colletotrichum gloeosporioides 23]|nr:hypothetical protein K456DRAFT_31093 [Colletotrichum gloeosporioides 23]
MSWTRAVREKPSGKKGLGGLAARSRIGDRPPSMQQRGLLCPILGETLEGRIPTEGTPLEGRRAVAAAWAWAWAWAWARWLCLLYLTVRFGSDLALTRLTPRRPRTSRPGTFRVSQRQSQDLRQSRQREMERERRKSRMCIRVVHGEDEGESDLPNTHQHQVGHLYLTPDIGNIDINIDLHHLSNNDGDLQTTSQPVRHTDFVQNTLASSDRSRLLQSTYTRFLPCPASQQTLFFSLVARTPVRAKARARPSSTPHFITHVGQLDQLPHPCTSIGCSPWDIGTERHFPEQSGQRSKRGRPSLTPLPSSSTYLPTYLPWDTTYLVATSPVAAAASSGTL